MDRTVKILVILFAVVGISLFGYHWVNQWHTSRLQQATQAEKEACLQKIAQLEAEVAQLVQEVGGQRSSLQNNADLRNVFGVPRPQGPGRPEAVDCQQVTQQAVAFFRYLDSKAYLLRPGIDMQAEELFEELSAKLSAQKPINTGEMEDLYSLMRNVTHFYRILGKDRVEAIKEILKSEAEVMEPAMAVMFSWLTACNSGADPGGKAQPGLDNLYQYASFFLNTLGGRSYLLRRDSRVRMLVNYYSLLIIDMANDAQRNPHGLDLRPHLDYLFYDLDNQKGLMYRERYLTRLAALRNKYAP
jgi:hypothetical protein